MFGLNPIRRQELDPDGQLTVQEIFLTIQGEGPFAGYPAVFVRLAGCCLACTWCDTDFETGMNNGMTAQEVFDQIRLLEQDATPRLVVITGGEPLRQNILPLCTLLTNNDYHTQIETAGVMWVPHLEDVIVFGPYLNPGVSLVCSPKTGKVDESIAKNCLHWKYILREGEISSVDGLPVYSTQVSGVKQKLYRPNKMPDKIYVQPCDEHDPDKTQRNVQLTVRVALKHGYRLSLQLHKTLGLP